MNSITYLKRIFPLRAAIIALAMGLVIGGVASTALPSSAQEPPALLPLLPPLHIVTFQVEAAAAAQYDEALTVLDFEPNAATYERRHDGMAFFSVVDGAVTLRKDAKDTVYTKGQSFRQDPGAYYSIANKTSAKARIITTTLTSPGSAAEANHPDAVRPAILPTIAFFGKATFNSVSARFSHNHAIFEFPPRGGSGAHIHPAGQGIQIVMSGEVRQRLLTGDVLLKPGDVFIDVPNRPVSHENAGSQGQVSVVAYIFAPGPPAALPAVIPGVMPLPAPAAPGAAPAPPAPAISPPRTGDGGLK